ncbi:MAG: hypothetical protein KAY37_06995 [Phycisphaerae bacterium]|nr:hypothetical protein [Phycisphaerae bacterium]
MGHPYAGAPGATALEQCVREVTVPPRALLTLRLRSGQAPQWHTGGRNARPTLNPEPSIPHSRARRPRYPRRLAASNNGEKPINLFQLGCLFVIRTSYWSCRIGNEPQDFHLSPHEVESKAIASFGSKELVDPHKGRKVFQQIEKKARHQ